MAYCLTEKFNSLLWYIEESIGEKRVMHLDPDPSDLEGRLQSTLSTKNTQLNTSRRLTDVVPYQPQDTPTSLIVKII